MTLEDILTQDPREKLELFPGLGYYFLSFRAIESRKTRDRLRNMLSEDAANAADEGIVGEVNMYLVVFREGICSVSTICHPMPLVAVLKTSLSSILRISKVCLQIGPSPPGIELSSYAEHIDRVRHRIMLLDESSNASSGMSPTIVK